MFVDHVEVILVNTTFSKDISIIQIYRYKYQRLDRNQMWQK